MLGWLGLLLIIFALWRHYVYRQVTPGCGEEPVQKTKIRNLDSNRALDNQQLQQYYDNANGESYIDRCYPDVSDQFRGIFQEQSGSANSGVRIGDAPPELFY
jgi:hypothetical protein